MTGRELLELLQAMPDHRLDLVVRAEVPDCQLCGCRHIDRVNVHKVLASPYKGVIWLREG